MEIPGFDPKSMSDDELLKKQDMIAARLVWANRFSGNGDIIGQFQKMLAAITQERIERINRKSFTAMLKAFPDVIETDPDLAQARAEEEAVAQEATAKPKQRQQAPVRRTAKPVVPEKRIIVEKKDE